MKNFESFVKQLSTIIEVEGVTGKNTYRIVSIENNKVNFIRGGHENIETIKLTELYELYSSVNQVDLNTSIAKYYISGRVQSPAVAILKAIREK